MMNVKSERLNNSVSKASDILLSFIDYDEQGATEISQNLHLTKSTVHILLRTLKAKGLIDQNLDNKKYCLGVKAFQIGLRWVRIRETRLAAKDIMQKLCDELHAAIHLTIISGDQALIVEKIEPYVSFTSVPYVGWTMPLHSTVSGKLLLAFSPDEVVNRILQKRESIKYRDNTITDRATLLKALAKIREKGYSADEGKKLIGMLHVAVPIYDYAGNVFAALGITGHKENFPPALNSKLISRLKAQAKEISERLGYRA
jgi:IclR family transcriptional regulator, KDG regulon repressor